MVVATPEAQVALNAAGIEHASQAACTKLANPATTPEERALVLAQLVVLMGQIEGDIPVPQCLLALTDELVAAVTAADSDEHCRKNSIALLSSLLSMDELTWTRLVVRDDGGLVAALTRVLESCTGADVAAGPASPSQPPQPPLDAPLCINVLTALTAAAQGGLEGAHAVLGAAALPHIHGALALAREPPDGGRGDQINEAAADALCTLSTYEACRPTLVAQGTVAAVAQALGTAGGDLRAQLLLCLGMLLPSSEEAQDQVASSSTAVSALVAAMRQSEDPDAKEVARVLFSSLAQRPACKQALAAAMRAAA